MKKYKHILFAICAIFAVDGVLSAVLSPEARLTRDILQNYDSRTRPVMDPNSCTDVNMSFSIKSIEKLDEKNRIFYSFGWMMMSWQDELLVWDPDDYNGTNRIVLPCMAVWLPELTFYNSVDEGDDISLSATFRVSVRSDGMVTFAPGWNWKTSCNVDLTLFPFDEQTCTVMFVNWMYGQGVLSYVDGGVSLDVYEENEEWTLLNATSFAGISHGVPVSSFSVRLRRKPSYYVLNMMLPSMTISALTILVFLLPSEAGEKMSLAITILLAYTILLLMMSDVTPKSGVTTPILTMYIVVSMSMASLAILMTIIVIQLHHRAPTSPVPAWLRIVCFRGLAVPLCMSGDVGRTPAAISVGPMAQTKDEEARSGAMENLSRVERSFEVSLPADVMSYIRGMIKKDVAKRQEDNNGADWMILARIVDRFMLILFIGVDAILAIWLIVSLHI